MNKDDIVECIIGCILLCIIYFDDYQLYENFYISIILLLNIIYHKN